MLSVAQVVAALDAEAALAADHSACGERAERQHPKNRTVEDCVDDKARPNGAKRQGDAEWLVKALDREPQAVIGDHLPFPVPIG